VQLGVPAEMRAVREALATFLTDIRSNPGVNTSMTVQVAAVLESLTALVTNERPLVGVYASVLHQVAVRVELLLALLAGERFHAAVDPRVIVQLSVGHELLAAQFAHEHLKAGVYFLVLADGAQLQEPLVADLARVRPLAGVNSAVGRQVRAAEETFAAHVAHERPGSAGVHLFVAAQIGGASERLHARFTLEQTPILVVNTHVSFQTLRQHEAATTRLAGSAAEERRGLFRHAPPACRRSEIPTRRRRNGLAIRRCGRFHVSEADSADGTGCRK
jgi:hypothetical protein